MHRRTSHSLECSPPLIFSLARKLITTKETRKRTGEKITSLESKEITMREMKDVISVTRKMYENNLSS